MDSKNAQDGLKNFLALQKQGIPHTEFRLGRTAFRLSDAPDGDDRNPLVRRDDVWQDMLRMVLGHVPEGAEHAPPCLFELRPCEKRNFAGLAGLPSAVHLMDGFFPVRNQSKRGACFAFALVSLCEYMLRKKVKLSEQSLFFFTKLTTHIDVDDLCDGVATLRDAVRAVSEYGICPMADWHYNPNPESWNYVDDPHGKKQGSALERILALAKQYRFSNFEILPSGAVLEFKQALSSGRPVCIGVATTNDWHSDDVDRTGKIPYPLRCQISIRKPSLDMALQYLKDEGVEITEENIRAVQSAMIDDTVQAIKKFIFSGSMFVRGIQENEAVVSYDVCALDLSGGHALCLAGYVDDSNYPGGGYFIARNSWFDEERCLPWASESPEEPGYALLPYAYVADFCSDGGVVMSDFPQLKTIPDGNAITGSAHDGFASWLAECSRKLDRPMRDQDGVLLRPGSQVLVPDPANPTGVLRDTPQNRAKLRDLYERQRLEASVAAEKVREEQEKAAADARQARFETVLRETVDRAFAADEYAIMTLATLKSEMLSRDPDLASVTEIDSRIRASVIALQKSDKRKYWFGRGFEVEEIRPSGEDAKRIFV